MDDGRPFRLDADGDARARENGAVMADERDVGGATDADDARAGSLRSDPVDERGENGLVRQAVDRLAKSAQEGGTDRDNDLVRALPVGSLATNGEARAVPVASGDDLVRIELVGEPLEP